MVKTLSLGEVAQERIAAAAGAELADLHTLRVVHDSLANKIDQQEVAGWLKISQPMVSKIAKRARLNPHLLTRSPREVILERAAGKLGVDAMMAELRAWSFTFDSVVDADAAEPEWIEPGTIRQIESAYREGMLSGDEYEAIVVAANASDSHP